MSVAAQGPVLRALQAVLLFVSIGCGKESEKEQGSSPSTAPAPAGTGGIAGGMAGDAAAPAPIDAMSLTREEFCSGATGEAPGGVGVFLVPDEDCPKRVCGDPCDPCIGKDGCSSDGASHACDRYSRCLAIKLRD